jgi:hypothetical protein
MFRRALPVLLAALVAECAGAAGFTEAPHAGQLAALIGTCIFAAALQTMDSADAAPSKKVCDCETVLIASDHRFYVV